MSQSNITAGIQITANVDGIQEINNLSQAVDDASEQVQEMQRIVAAKTTLGLDVDDHARAEIQKLDKAFDDLKRSGGLSQAELARAAQLHAQKVGELEQSLKRTKPSLADMTNGIQGLVGAGGGLAYVTNEAIKFESAMAQVKKVTDATPEQINALSGSLKEMAGQLGMMPDELAQIAAAGGQMGLTFDKLPQFTQMTAQMANAFGISADAAGEMSSKISNVYGLQINEMAELGDAINALGNTTAAKEKEIGEVLMRMGGNAKQFGLLKEEAAALAATFVSLGKSPEEAGTAINALLSKLQSAKIGTNDFKDGLNALGLSAEEMAANIAANPQRALDDFLQRLDKLDKQARSEILGQMFGAEYSDDLALLTGSLKTYTEAVATATDHTKNFGAMQREADAALNTTEGKMNQAKAEIASAAIELGNTLLPIIQLTANVIGDVAKAVTSVSEQYPVLSQMAVLFLGAKVASEGLSASLKLLGVDSETSFGNTKKSLSELKKELKDAAQAAKEVGRDIKNAVKGNLDDMSNNNNAIKKLSGSLKEMAAIVAEAFAAFEVGHGMGTWLYENVGFAQNLGDNMAKVIAYMDAMVTDRTFEDVNREFRTTNELARELEKNQKAAAQAAEKRKATEAQAAEAQKAKLAELRAEYSKIQQKYDEVSGSLKKMADDGKANTQAYRDLSAEQALLAGKLMQSQLALKDFSDNNTANTAQIQAALNNLGVTAEQLSGNLSKAASASIADFATAAASIGNHADQMATVFQAAVEKMDSPEALFALKNSLSEAGAKAGLTADEINQIAALAPQLGLGLAQISKPLGDAEAAATALGVSLENALLLGTTGAMTTALGHFDKLTAQLDGLKQNGINTGMVLRESLSKLTDTAQSEGDIDALKFKINQLGETGKLSMQDVERAILAADQKLNQLKQNTDPTAQAFESLGIQTRESLRLAGEESRQAFELVKNSGQATAADIQAAFAKTAQSLLASGDISQKSWVEANAAAYNYAVTVDATGKASLQAAAQTQQAADTQIQAHQQVTQAATESAQAQSQAAKAAVENVENVGKAAESSQHKMSDLGSKVHETLKKMGAYATFGTASWANTLRSVQDMYININQTVQRLNEETENGGNIAEHLARTELMAANNVRKLDKTTLNNLHQAIDKARQKMQQLADEAANARKEAEKELLRAQGRDGDVQKLEQQEKLNALKRKQAQAQKTGNRQAQDDYAAAIAAQQAAYQAQAEREAEQERERQQQQREAEQQRLQQQREAEQQRQQQERERLQREAEQMRFRLPENKVDLSDMDWRGMQFDFSGVTEALAARDNQIKQQIPNLIKELMPQIAQELIKQIQKDNKRSM